MCLCGDSKNIIVYSIDETGFVLIGSIPKYIISTGSIVIHHVSSWLAVVGTGGDMKGQIFGLGVIHTQRNSNSA